MGTTLTTQPAEAAAAAGTHAIVGHATCPLCHTADASLTEEALRAGGEWCCVTCSARWDAARVATVTAYRAWVREHRPDPRAT